MVQDALNNQAKSIKGSNVLVLGAAYKPDIDDLRESPALDVIGLLRQKGSKVSNHDPYILSIEHDDWDLQSVPDMLTAARQADCVVIITNHSSYDYDALLDASQLVVDTRNALGSASREHSKVIRL